FAQMAQSLPSYQRVNEVRIVSTEFPRTRLGKLRRAEIRRMLREQRGDAPAEKQLDPEAEALLASPAAGALIARLRALAHREGAILPSDHLELDLGLDSLARVELDVIMEREFGVKIPPEQAPDIATVGDLLRRLSDAAPAAAAARGWGEMLRERASPPLAEMFDLERSRFRRNALHAVRHALFRFGQRAFPIDVRGAHLLPKGPFVLCPTHASFLDALLVFTAIPDRVQERMFFLAYEDMFRSPPMRLAARIGYVVLTATSDTLLPSLRRAIEALDLGWSVTIFPEGAISRDGALQRARPGAGILACHSGAPLVPCLIRGSFDTLSYAHPRFRLVPLGLTFGAPIHPRRRQEFTSQDYASMTQAWTQAIIELRRQDDASGSPTAGRSPRVDGAGAQGGTD
ncbi:MAG TPA: 1-acyl-sn-glycerol-3-phosphate acyltransferase, partial [Candidatus Brocadiia bacterium]|nr:1-acyl-sn-glycerol-3-phosphate acyltransferase [Candidatus Brocadiia bacterium]